MPPTEKDLIAEEKSMRAMSFGDHIEDLRKHLFLAVLGLFVGVILTFIPPLDLGKRVMGRMEEPAKVALARFYAEQAGRRAKEADEKKLQTAPMHFEVEGKFLAEAMRRLYPDLKPPSEEALSARVPLQMRMAESDLINGVARSAEPKNALISLAPLEPFMVYFGVCVVTGLVISSPWVFYQIWAFIAAGLYRHERHYVKRYIPFSLGLFLGGVFLCFFWVLPYTLQFLLEFNVWLKIEPSLRINEWMSFATILPLVFGICFQTPLVMLLLDRIGVFNAEVYRSKRRFAILVIVIVAAVITPTGDPVTLGLLAIPMILLYELGILLVKDNVKKDTAVA